MNWADRLEKKIIENTPGAEVPKVPNTPNPAFCHFGHPDPGGISENKTPDISTPIDDSEHTYHGFTPTDLEAEAADEWQEIQNDPAQLEAFAYALKTTRTRQQGERPDHYTKAAECAACGPVWLWEGAPDKVQGCPWCLNRGPIPRPGAAKCRDCTHWVPDAINPLGGLGQCLKNVPGLAWPIRKLNCGQYQELT